MSAERTAALSIAFSLEELVVMAELCDLRLPVLGERPLAGLRGAGREAVLDVASRSLLARGVLMRDEGLVSVVRAASGLLEILAASSLKVEVVVEREGTRDWHTIYAIPYAAVDTTIDGNANHRFAPFATGDLLLHVGRMTGLLDTAEPASPSGQAPGPEGDLVPGAALAPVSLRFGAWRTARASVRRGETADALAALVDAGLPVGTAGTLLEVLRATEQTASVQIVHHPTARTTAGGEVAWVEAGPHGTWLVPTIDQPFGRLPRPGEHDGSYAIGTARAGGPDDAELEALDGIDVTIAPTARAAILRDLHSVLPVP